jgi:hypothetical protein
VSFDGNNEPSEDTNNCDDTVIKVRHEREDNIFISIIIFVAFLEFSLVISIVICY